MADVVESKRRRGGGGEGWDGTWEGRSLNPRQEWRMDSMEANTSANFLLLPPCDHEGVSKIKQLKFSK